MNQSIGLVLKLCMLVSDFLLSNQGLEIRDKLVNSNAISMGIFLIIWSNSMSSKLFVEN